ncbi:putative ATP-dependent helicase Lhr [Methyloglobulus morosus KoM1]|uniref:Putative ATP-dependent helicase Lhr n=1 Tax=Methyloglobulus morosus KoM1 TaxID=1116472 RepID=V5BIK4_9GAMM|nr:DEAD/DEAH box helicase [Methyloglobulus morosus]ESS73125.1 putative ATP-dependent helicase Lhr [Methyloglobulus morosus KoM1]
MSTVLSAFHPVVADWFLSHFKSPTEAQNKAWPVIQAGQSALIAAPTGSGKTLAAFLAVIDQLVKQGLSSSLPNQTQVLYVSPLKALSNDINKNLEQPLLGIGMALLEASLPGIAIRAQTRTGDTSQIERAAMKRFPPHILVTTPESLFILLTSESGREMLKTVRTVIVDEIHALAGNKRGAHLMLSLERLAQLTGQSPVRIGLSATQKPLTTIAQYLIGDRDMPCTIIDIGHIRKRDLLVEVTSSPLEAIMANEVWTEIYDRLETLVNEHRTTLIFVNTRRLAERAAAALADRLGEAAVTAHHGSLAKEHRLSAEHRLKQGQLKALVATASLELGIDIGDVDLVCQLGSPHSIAAFLQRVGRSGHSLEAIPKGRLFPLSRNDLLECAALLNAIAKDQLDSIKIPDYPLDVLSQQIVAEVACREWNERELFQALTLAWPYRTLTVGQYTAVVKMLSDGYHTRRGRRSAYLHRDAVQGVLRPRKGARLTAIMNGGAIPDQFDYNVILQPEGLFIGTLNEDFAFESMPGDIFQLGNTSYRMLKIEQGKVYVEDAHGQPPNIPFWLGEAPGRSDELSAAVSELTATIDRLLERGEDAARQYIYQQLALPLAAAEQLFSYLAAAKAALTVLPTFNNIIFERFFDETADMHFVIHSVYGSRINKAWGLALRKRFCRRFNFELQAAADENNIVLSLGPTHSFPLNEPSGYLKAETVQTVLTQALLDAPMFPTRWRWVANTALAVPRNRAGKKIPAIFQRNDAEDLVAVIFPDQLACIENIAGDREIPDHPLVNQTLWDCLHELMDIDGLKQVLTGIENGSIQIITRDLTGPSPMAQEIINAKAYAFLDDAPAEERRTLAIQQRRLNSPQDAAEIGRLNPEAIDRVRLEAWPEFNNADELHDALVVLGFMTEQEGQHGPLPKPPNTLAQNATSLLGILQSTHRATVLTLANGQRLWVSAERLHECLILFPDISLSPDIAAVTVDRALSLEDSLRGLVHSRMEYLGPITVVELAQPLGMAISKIEQTLLALEQQGIVLQGQFTPGTQATEWCERGLLARIHRYTQKQLRSEIEPVAPADFMRFLFKWHGLHDPVSGESGLSKVLQQLEGCHIAAASWEPEILAKRVKPYFASELDQLCTAGRFVWLRLKSTGENSPKSARKSTPIALIARTNIDFWRQMIPLPVAETMHLTGNAQKVFGVLKEWGASFFQEIVRETGLLKTQLEEALGELAAAGLITSDSFHGLRTLVMPQTILHRRSKRYPSHDPMASAGRWSLLRPPRLKPTDSYEHVEHIARNLLLRYGVVFRKVLEREESIPSWRELIYIYRRLEARGELRGGRFVEGFSGEQFALPEAVNALNAIRKQEKTAELTVLSTADPLNLSGLITPGERIASLSGNRLVYRDGVPVAHGSHRKINFLQTFDAENQRLLQAALLGK